MTNGPVNFNIALTRKVKVPTRANPLDAGIDFFVPDDFVSTNVQADGDVLIPCGVKVKIPSGFALIFMNKSGVATKKKLVVGACVVDETYQGEVHMHMINTGRGSVRINPGDKLVQGLLIPVSYATPVVVDEADLYESESDRGAGGFGSTGSS